MGQKFTNEQIVNAVKAMNGMVYLAARQLGCSPTAIYKRIRELEKQVKELTERIDAMNGSNEPCD